MWLLFVVESLKFQTPPPLAKSVNLASGEAAEIQATVRNALMLTENFPSMDNSESCHEFVNKI